jgi:hypothetical protein
MTYNEKIVDVNTGEETIRLYTKKEIDEVEKAIVLLESKAQAEATKAAEKAAVLSKLGLTADEVAALLS